MLSKSGTGWKELVAAVVAGISELAIKLEEKNALIFLVEMRQTCLGARHIAGSL